MIKLKHIKWSGIYGFGDGNFNYDFNSGFNLVTGRNGSGKSSFLNLISLALFDKSPSVSKNQAVNENCSRGYVSLFFEIEDKKYNVWYERDSEKLNWNLRDDSGVVVFGRDTGSYISDLIGFNYDQFINSFYLTQMSSTSLKLLYGTPSDRLEILSRVFGTDRIINASEASRERKKGEEKKALDLDREISGLKGKLSGYDDVESELSLSMERWKLVKDECDKVSKEVQDKSVTEDRINSKEKEIREIGKTIENKKSGINDLTRRVLEYEEHVKKGAETLIKFKNLESKAPVMKEIESEIENLRESVELLKSDLSDLYGKRSFCDIQIRSLQNRLYNVMSGEGICDKCGSEVSKDHIEKFRSEILESLEKARKEEENIDERLDEINSLRIGKESELSSKQIKVDDINKHFRELEDYEKDHVEKVMRDEQESMDKVIEHKGILNKEIIELLKEEDILEREIEKEKEKLKEIIEHEKKLSALESELNSINRRIDELQEKEKDRKELELKIGKLNTKIEKVKENIEVYDFWIKGFKEISILKLRSMIEGVNDKMEAILSKFGMRCWLDVLEEKKSSKRHDSLDDYKRKINLFIESEGKSKTPIEAYSGGEKQLVSLALILAMGETLSNINFLALDEIFGSMDKENRSLITDFLEDEMKAGVLKDKAVFIITHDNEIISGLEWNSIIEMEKQNWYSNIKML
jgi:exonuclease SbcC